MKNQNLLFFLIALIISFSGQIFSQPWFGQRHYSHDSTFLSSAQLTSGSGYVMGGFRPQSQYGSSIYDFVIDKVDASGLFSSPSDFSGRYIIKDDSACTGKKRYHTCKGIYVIQTSNLGSGEAYAVAGAFSEGAFFATLTSSGSVIRYFRWKFTNSAPFGTRPYLSESPTDQGKFYICGTDGTNGYVIKLNAATNPITSIWANKYSAANFAARAVMENPYTTDEVVVVGKTDDASSNTFSDDAFFMKLNKNSGAITTFTAYNKQYDGDEWLTSIQPAASTQGGSNGFIVGGRSHYPFTPPCFSPPCAARVKNWTFTQWMMKITPLGAVVWTSLIMPSAAGSATICNEISDVHERWNPYNSNYEYYGVAGHGAYPTAGVGNNLVVYKLDDNGSNTLSPDEFHYSQGHGPSNPFSLAELTLIGNGTGSNDGIQVFGTYGSTASQHHFVKAYFNGVSDCYESHTNIDSIKAGPSSLSTHNISVSQVATNCQLLFEIIYTSNTTGVTTLCSASSVSSGNNNKHAFISGINENEISKISISPNPVNSHLKIKVDGLDNNILSIQIQDVAGRLYNTNFAKISNEEYKVELNELSLTPGYYLLFVKGKDTFYAKPFIIDLK